MNLSDLVSDLDKVKSLSPLCFKNYQFLQLVHLQTSVDSCTEYLNPFSISEQEMYF